MNIQFHILSFSHDTLDVGGEKNSLLNKRPDTPSSETTLPLGLQIPPEKVFGVGLEGPWSPRVHIP